MPLTRNQRRAIQHPKGHLQLLACAGSGKTEVVARRVAWLLENGAKDGVTPGSIVAFTFTEKAAAELKDRIGARCREALGDVVGLAEMFVGTIHAFCLETLKAEVPEYLKYEVLNEVQQALFLERNSRRAGLTESVDLAGKPLHRFRDSGLYQRALDILRESVTDPRALEACSVSGGLDAWRGLLREKSLFDYSAILELAADELETNESLRARIRGRVRYVIVDEYQDVNPVQERIVTALRSLGAEVCVVGDDDQTIYQWRGSEIAHIRTFPERYAGTTQVPLEENFRSSEAIVALARHFIDGNGERVEKAMKHTGAQPFEKGDVAALAFGDPEAEAAHVAATIRSLHGTAFDDKGETRGLDWSDFAILLRSVRNDGGPFCEALRAAGIPVVIVGMSNLFETPEVRAARELFWFIGGFEYPESDPNRRAVDEESLRQAWMKAGVAAKPAKLKEAIRRASETRAALAADPEEQERWAFYSIQREFMSFLATLELREDGLPDDRAEVVLYNLGKFSQVISDFETIHFHSSPATKYESFAKFLYYRAPGAYAEGLADNQYASPNAVQILTVHQAKGMQWPAVFLPALRRNRFPAAKVGGRSVWHLIPREGIVGHERFAGSEEDERRLFYVAMTRAEKFLQFSWSPIPGSRRYQRPSAFFDEVAASSWVATRAPSFSRRARSTPRSRPAVANVVLSFSDIKYFFECPYQFKLRILYGFNPPIHEALGYGKSLHDALAEVHQHAMAGKILGEKDVEGLVERHLHLPYSYPALRKTLEASATRILRQYLAKNAKGLLDVEFAEKKVELDLGEGVSVAGRIDLVRRPEGTTTIVDLKTREKVQAEQATETQLAIYALGYQALTGRRADFIEVYDLDRGAPSSTKVDDELVEGVRRKIRTAADALREGRLPRLGSSDTCSSCDYATLCSTGCRFAKGPRASR